MSDAERIYSVEEARGLLPDLRERLTRIREARRVLLEASERMAAGTTGNGGGKWSSEFYSAVETLREEIEHLAADGIILRDGDSGLVDLPSLRDGRPIFLCWRSDEQRLGFWHEVDSGFSSRKPL